MLPVNASRYTFCMPRPSRFVLCLSVLGMLGLVLVGGALAQQPRSPEPAPDTQRATITYQVDSPQRDPARFSVTIDSLGHATYAAEDNTADPSAGEQASSPSTAEGPEGGGAYRVAFEVSPRTRDRIFALAQQLS